MTTLILGGGVTGLAAAWHLQQRGEAVEVWEAAPTVGGWMKTLPWEGGHIETGPQGVLWQPGTAVDRLFTAIGLPFKSPGTGARWVGKGGHLIPVPAAPPALLISPLMSLGTKLRMMLEPFVKVRPAEPEEGLSAFIARRLGPGVATDLLPAWWQASWRHRRSCCPSMPSPSCASGRLRAASSTAFARAASAIW